MLVILNDYCYSINSPTTDYGNVPSFVHTSKLPAKGFGSLYLVTKDDAEAIKQAGTTARFAGSVWSGRLWLDVDSFEAADKVEERINAMGLGYVAYLSGNRGVHFGILRNANPSHLLPLQDRDWVRAHFPEADDSIYTHLHLFRLPGTPHLKTGKPKELVLSKHGKAIEHTAWKSPKPRQDLKITPYFGSSVFESIRVMGNTVPTTNGTRHPTLVRLVYALQDKGVDPAMALWWVGEVNKMAEEPKEDWELEKMISSIYGASCG